MMRSTMLRKTLRGIITAFFWLLVWYITAEIIDKELFLPTPFRVIERFIELSQSIEFWKITAVSLVRIMCGFGIGVIFGSLFAFVTHYLPFAKTLLSPALKTVRATPVVSFILLAFLWLNADLIPVFIAFLMVLPIIWENIAAGLDNLDNSLIEMSRVYRMSRNTRFSKIIMPSISPYFYSGCFTSLGLAWKSGIAAEVISYPSIAIGREMNSAKVVLETADVMVWTVVVVVLSMVMEKLFKTLFKRRTLE